MSSVLIYIHGFNSSAFATKSQLLKKWCLLHRPDIKFLAPDLPPYPQQAMQVLQSLVKEYDSDNLGLVGSSLGGYFAAYLNQQYGFRAVLVNPAVTPYILLKDYLGVQKNPYTGETFHLKSKHIDELKALDVDKVKDAEKICLIQQEGDEVLDYKQAVNKYRGCKQIVESGGNHSFVGFERFCEHVVQFLAL